MNPWKPGAPVWWYVINGERVYDSNCSPTPDDAIQDYLETLEEGERLPYVLRLRGFVDDCDTDSGEEDFDCSEEDEHEIKSYAHALVPTRQWLLRHGRAALRDTVGKGDR